MCDPPWKENGRRGRKGAEGEGKEGKGNSTDMEERKGKEDGIE